MLHQLPRFQPCCTGQHQIVSVSVDLYLSQDPAKARLHEEAARLSKKLSIGQTELDNLKRSAKAQAKRLTKLKKDLAQLQDAKVSCQSPCYCAIMIAASSYFTSFFHI